MKYAVLGPQLGINRISNTEPQNVGKQSTVVEITDEQAKQVIASPQVHYVFIGGELKTLAEKQAANMTPEQKIAAGEQHVANAGLTGARLVTLMDLLLTTKEADALASKPKLVALYTWLQTVKSMSIAGVVTFPPAPHTFEEVIGE
ncbi:hypothetical protein [Propionivibrio sp.]|uniref:hypothetical protein n=1 Tax=Propionivibrio sp. TaxID=2212460 RepID=UPI003BF11215